MIKKLVPYSLFVLALHMQWGCSNGQSLRLDIPKDGFKVVQHIPEDAVGRAQNTLYQTPRPIEEEEFKTEALTTVVDSMYSMMLQKAGVGIAANQLGKRLQLFIIEAKVNNPRYQVLGPVEKQIFINPVITKVSEKRKNFWHGCLSAVGEKRGNVATFEWIEYECKDLNGKIMRGRLDGFSAVIFQHEYRHLMKGTYLDHANHLLSLEALSQQLEAREVPFFEQAKDSLPLLIYGFKLNTPLEDY